MLPRALLFVAAMLCPSLCLTTPLVRGAESQVDTGSAPAEFVIRPQPGEWNADPENVQAVLDSAAAQLAPHLPGRKYAPILVEPKGGPIVFYQRGPAGEFRVQLSTGGTYWSQYSFQFAHELCHIVCGANEKKHRHGWFEEALCETASLYVLRSMGREWRVSPPYSNWKSYGRSLEEYAEQRIEEARLPEGNSPAAWCRDHAEQLERSATNRELNNVVAGFLLPRFEEEPARWEALEWLNRAEVTEADGFADYLAGWSREAPERHRPWIEGLFALFELERTNQAGNRESD